jgi:hypothetical protein
MQSKRATRAYLYLCCLFGTVTIVEASTMVTLRPPGRSPRRPPRTCTACTCTLQSTFAPTGLPRGFREMQIVLKGTVSGTEGRLEGHLGGRGLGHACTCMQPSTFAHTRLLRGTRRMHAVRKSTVGRGLHATAGWRKVEGKVRVHLDALSTHGRPKVDRSVHVQLLLLLSGRPGPKEQHA